MPNHIDLKTAHKKIREKFQNITYVQEMLETSITEHVLSTLWKDQLKQCVTYMKMS